MKKLLKYTTLAFMAIAVWMFLKSISECHTVKEGDEPDFYDDSFEDDDEVFLD